MECDILDNLDHLGYHEEITDDVLVKWLNASPASPEFSRLVSWLSLELKALCKLEEHVNPVTDNNDVSSFMMELSSFLRETCCPRTVLMNGPMMERLNTRENCLLLLGFLCTELMAARMEVDQNPERNKLIVQVRESGPAKDLKSMLILLSFAKPPPTITPLQLFSKIEPKIKDLTKNVPAHVLGKPILKGLLSDIQWQNIEAIGQELEKEYTIRRQMLIKRLDVTIQSFNWSQRMKGKQDEMVKAYRPIRCMLLLNMDIGVADVLSARDDLIKDEKVSSSNTRKKTQCAVNKVLMGRVPDRGGRPYEAQPPPAEMPFFKKREAGGQGGGRGGGGGGWGGGYRGGGGGRGDQGGGYRGGGGRGGRGGRGGGGGGGGVYNQPHHGQGGTFQQYGGGEDRGGGGGYGRGGGGHRY